MTLEFPPPLEAYLRTRTIDHVRAKLRKLYRNVGGGIGVSPQLIRFANNFELQNKAKKLPTSMSCFAYLVVVTAIHVALGSDHEAYGKPQTEQGNTVSDVQGKLLYCMTSSLSSVRHAHLDSYHNICIITSTAEEGG